MRIVDAHVHVWDVDAMPIPWFRDDLGLPRAPSADDLARAVGATGVGAALAVQAADSVEEASWLVDVAARHPLVRRAVLQFRPGRAGLAAEQPSPSVAGFRAAVPQCAADLSDVEGLDDLAAQLGDAGLVLETLVRPAQLPAVAALSRRHPETSIVLCHLGLGAGPADAAWRAALHEAASAPGVSAKVSGLALPERDPAEAGSIVAAAFAELGPERLMFGSDWPMSVRACSYSDVLDATRAALPRLPDAACTAFWSATATRLYLGT